MDDKELEDKIHEFIRQLAEELARDEGIPLDQAEERVLLMVESYGAKVLVPLVRPH